MYVGIIAAGTGTAPVYQFREGADEAAAMTAFVNSYSPPKNPANWIAFDTGWTSPQKAATGKEWACDRDTLTLLEDDLPAVIADPGGDWQNSVLDDSLTIPPVAPIDGDRYIVPVGATGAWAGKEAYIAQWDAAWGVWQFAFLIDGCFAYVLASGTLMKFTGTSWVSASNVGYETDSTERSSTRVQIGEYRTFTTPELRPGTYNLDISVQGCVNHKSKTGQLLVLLDGSQEIMRAVLRGQDWDTHTNFVEVTFTGAAATHTIEFQYSSPHQITSVKTRESRYRIWRT